MQDLLLQQRTYFDSQATKPLSFRRSQLKKLKQVLQQNEALLFDAIYTDFKKSKFETFATELVLIYKEIDEALNNLRYWARPKSVGSNLVNFPGTSNIIPEPLGVSLIIGSWNYPYLVTFSPLVAAVAAGNTAIIKPSEISVTSSKAIHTIISQHFEADYLAVVEGGIPETTQLLAQNFDKIFFTGSTKVGRIVYQAAAKNLTPVTLELGGKSPAFVTDNCNLSKTVQRLIWAKFLNAGQTCIAPDYVLVDQKIKDQFLSACKREIAKRVYSIEKGNYVQIINTANFERLLRMIPKDNLYFGGKNNEEERYLEPTILTNITTDDLCMQEEIFGPILPVIEYTSLAEAITMAKKLPKPLSAYIFSNKKEEQHHILSRFSFGGGAVNDAVMHITNPNLPFGGVGSSGIGSYRGEQGFKAFSHYKSVLKKANWLELPLKYSPYSTSKLNFIKRILKL